MKVMIDLFCGLGGASSGFKDTEWKIIRIDNDETLKEIHRNIWILDMNDWCNVLQIVQLHLYEPDVKEIFIWASPPCTDFSAHNPNRPENPDTSLLVSTLKFITYMKSWCSARGIKINWIIENVKGAIQIFNSMIGHEYRQNVASFFMWGQFPFPIALVDSDVRNHTKPFNSTNGRIHYQRRRQIHAQIPLGLSISVRRTLDEQLSLKRWYS